MSNSPNKLFFIPALLTVLLVALPAFASDRALLVGVGKHRYSESNNLPGIDLDIEMMREVAQILKYDEIEILLDESATLANFEQKMIDWLGKGTAPDERVLIYFSGHGARIVDADGDESNGDQQDDLLIMHDTTVIEQNGRKVISNVLIDDRFSELLAQIPSRNITVLIDACHSGTATRSVQPFVSPLLGETSEAVNKFLYIPGATVSAGQDAGQGGFMYKQGPASAENYAGIAAAREDQRSLATPEGSYFTRTLYDTVREVAQAGNDASLSVLRNEVDQFLAEVLPPERRFNPQLLGNLDLADKPLPFAAMDGGYGANWQFWAAIVNQISDQSQPVSLVTNDEESDGYSEGEILVIGVDVPREGYLNVFTIDPQDVPTVLFPNRYHSDNRIQAGLVVIPTEQMPFDLRARPPYGPSLVVAVVSDQPINLYEEGIAQRDEKGDIVDVFSTVQRHSLRKLRAIQVEEKKRVQLMAGMIITKVCAQAGQC